MKKTILITGGTGFLGSHLIPKLISLGHEVRVLTTGSRKTFKEAPCYQWNLQKESIDPSALEGVTDIIHLAGASISKRWTPAYKQEIVDSRVIGPRILQKQLEKVGHNVNRFISASGISIYPHSYDLMTEEAEHASNFLGQVCEQWEAAADLLKPYAKNTIKLRIGFVLGDAGGLVPLKKVTNSGIGSGQGNGKQYLSWIAIQDLVNMFIWALTEEKIQEIYNAVSPNPVTNNNFMRTLARVMKRPFVFPKVPALVMKLVLGEMSTLVLTSNRISSQKIEDAGFKFEYPELTEALVAQLKK